MYTLETVEQAYRDRLSGYDTLSPDELTVLSVQLFHEIKVEGVPPNDFGSDMLLFEYGTYDWHDGQGRRFNFSVARQWCVPGNDEPYQLHISLYYEPAAFRFCWARSKWSENDPDSWCKWIRSTRAYKIAAPLGSQKYELWFEEC